MRSGFAFAIIVTLAFCAPALAYDWSTNPGSGTPEDPYQLSEPNHLIALGENPTISQGFNSFILKNDIVFDPNGNPNHVFSQSVIPSLKGSFDGRGFTIENLKISIGTYNNQPVGLIGGIYEGWGVKNLSIRNAQITAGNNYQKVGILCGLNTDEIRNCQVSGTIVCGTGSIKIGGICGSNGSGTGITGTITYCYADISISSSSATGALGECGGISGYNGGTITHSSAEGTIEAWSLSTIGGICGQQEYGEIVSCSTSVNITAQRYLGYSGGLCGQNHSGIIRSSYATGNMTSVGISIYIQSISHVGGFCGFNTQGKIDTCFSTGNISCGPIDIGGSEESGGFCGRNSGVGDEGIKDCYSTGNVICGAITNSWNKERWVGGFCGTNDASIFNCYSTGTVETDAPAKAGFCNINYDTFEHCFWDTETSGILTACCGGSSTGVSGQNTEQMQQHANFVGWDFVGESDNGVNEIWRMCADGVTYPRLSWEFARDGDFACGDGVDIADLQSLAEEWLTAADVTPAAFNYACDANGDEVIDLLEFGVLGKNW